ncbi:hypothetical protein GGR57DRAFT_455661 [Xylariaceae sp. FL1272]|nr:hypothetical protein GGR57DRAFT_455661 [Xylariaceae sp. FL1272]
MWVLENEGDGLEGKRLWLRPGKRYVFGRTVAEPGQIAVHGTGSEKVSRKHMAIRVDAVEDGHALVMDSRSKITIEDLGSKSGTRVNGTKYKGEFCTLSQESNAVYIGPLKSMFRITWFPIVLSFSYTNAELRTNPLSRLRASLEQLDIKLLSEYDTLRTTHVVSKKRNTPKCLQALVSGRFIVNDGFVNAVVNAAAPSQQTEDGVAISKLEQDFEAYWPDATSFTPAAGDEPVPRLPEAFKPNPARADIFDGYTFIFYEEKQFKNLLAPITDGKGKAHLHPVVAEQTSIDDFVRYVKGVAGEKGLGEFEDGSAGKGVVVVKWMPSSPDHEDWYEHFIKTVSLRLDHRLVNQKDFLDAILNNDASELRRPLEFESQPTSSEQQNLTTAAAQESMEVDSSEPPAPPSPKAPPRRRGREPMKSRFRGLALSLVDNDEAEEKHIPAPAPVPDIPPVAEESSQEGLFVSQDAAPLEVESTTISQGPRARSQRKRAGSPGADDLISQIAPSATQAKRRRIAAGEDPLPRIPQSPTPKPEPTPLKPTARVKKEMDVLEQARKSREEADRRAQEEREQPKTEVGEAEMEQIRHLHIREAMPLRQAPPIRSREQDIADGRWDPKWNGRKNFKRFQQRGAVQGRRADRIIVPLEPVRTKRFGIGDDFWVEDESSSRRAEKEKEREEASLRSQQESERSERNRRNVRRIVGPIDSSDEDDDDGTGVQVDDNEEEEDEAVVLTRNTGRTQKGRATASSRGTTQTQSQRSSGKRAAAPAAKEPAKRTKFTSVADSDEDSDEDGLRFRFRKR